jgi:hypothetical protein
MLARATAPSACSFAAGATALAAGASVLGAARLLSSLALRARRLDHGADAHAPLPPLAPRPSLRARLEADAAAAAAAADAARAPRPTASFAQRLAKTAECGVDLDAPRWTHAAIDDSTPFARLVADAAPPHRVKWVSKAFYALTGRAAADMTGRPALRALPAAAAPAARVAALADSLAARSRGCVADLLVATGGAAAPLHARVDVTPTRDERNAETTAMCFTIRPL